MDTKVNLAEKFALLPGPYQPGLVARLNDLKVLVVDIDGPFVWHRHEETDDFFYVVEGELTIHLRDRDVQLGPGELFVVPRGVEHCPEGHAKVLLIEPDGTSNTGDAGGDRSVDPIEL